jgi:PAS domain S-box-containing protein
VRTIAALPLRTGEMVIGILCLGFTEERDLPALRLLLDPVVQQLASGLQNSLLFDLSRQQAREMETHIRLLSLSSEIGAALTRSKDRQEMLAACCTLVLNSVNAAFVRIWTMRPTGDLLELQASRGIYTRTDGASQCKRVDMSNKIGSIAVSKRAYISNQLLGDPQIVDQEWVKREGMVAFAGHPLLVDDRVIGVLGLFSKVPLSEVVIQSLAAIADTIALAITNKEATEALAKSRERYRDLIETINDWVWKVDANGVYTYSSPSGSRILGLAMDEIIGQSMFAFMPEVEAERFRVIWQDICARQEPYRTLEKTVRHRDGQRLILESSGVPIVDDSGVFAGYRGIDRDISDRKRVEVDLRHAQKMEAMAVLSGGIAHDFNNLLHAISGYTALTLEDLDPESLAAKNLQEVAQATEKAGTLVRHILAFSAGDDTEVRPLPLQVSAQEVVKIMRDTLPSTIRVQERLDPHCREVRASASQIHQLLMNLCTNAYQAMREKGGTLEIGLGEREITQGNDQELPPGLYAQLSVMDSGQGMDDEVKLRIFEPYYTTKGRGEARGMGLAVVHGIVSSLGGRITVASAVGQGSTFVVYLPLIDQARGQTAAPLPLRTLAGRVNGHVLFVDDVDFNVRLGVQILEKTGCQVTGLTDSVTALALFCSTPEQFDLVITDQTMPVMTGSEMARRMLEIRPDIPIVMVTGHSESVDEQKAKSMGIRAFLAKPLRIDQLVTTIETIQRESARANAVRCAAPGPMPRQTAEGSGQLPRPTMEAVSAHLCSTYDLTAEMVVPMLGQFQNGLRTELAKANSAAELREQKALVMAAHTIKGLLLNAGLTAWAELAKTLEMKAREDEWGACATLLAELTPGLAHLGAVHS